MTPYTTIVVAAHKAVPIPSDALYLPVQVNACSNPHIAGFQPDDEGDNISALNYRYCELTALWWAWKNLDSGHLGLVHYRRHFRSPTKPFGSTLDQVLTSAEADALCARSELVLPRPRNYRVQTLAQHFEGSSFSEPGDVEVFRERVAASARGYGRAFDAVMARRSGHMCNMFIMGRALLDDYCSWLFEVLSGLDGAIADDRSRILGYFGEHMLDIWAERNGVGYAEVRQLSLDCQNEARKRVGYLLRLAGMNDASDRVVGRQR